MTGTDSKAQQRLQMADIARLAGVSTSTVSRALSGSSLVNEETRARVIALARSLKYSINIGAQNLRLKQNRTVGVVVPYDAATRQHLSDPFFLSMLGSLADALTEQGFDMLISRVDAETLDAAAQSFDSGRVIGIILIGQWRHHEQLNQLAAQGLAPDPQLYVAGSFLPQGGATDVQELLDRQIPFDAIFACSDLLAMSAISALRARGVAVPEQVAVVGYDDIELAAYFHPPLTTVRQPIRAAGRALVASLLALVDGAAAPSQQLPTELIVRASGR